MIRMRLPVLLLPLILAACQTVTDRDTIATLGSRQIEIREETLEDGLDKAMESYERFLKDTPDSALTPEAIRRLADLKIDREYGTITETGSQAPPASAAPLAAPEPLDPIARDDTAGSDEAPEPRPAAGESEADFENRATRSGQAAAPAAAPELLSEGLVEGGDDLEKAGPLEAIELYKELLAKYPLYEKNDQVLYQMSRAYEELGRIDEAMDVMDRMVREYPGSRYIDEVQFRRAEYFFSHKKYLDAEDAYTKIVWIGVGSSYYELALYKLGWTFYKQELYEEALHRYIALLDHKVSIGYDFEQTDDETEKKRMEDTFRVISLSFSNLGGADSVVEYFERYGQRRYEDSVYRQLAEFYFDKRRYADASETYSAFVDRNPFHKASPGFHMRIIEIHGAGGFPSLVLESKKAFATNYGLDAEYWHYFEPDARPEVLGWLKTNLTDLANHYHACYQDPNQVEDKPANFGEALQWYRAFLSSFPADAESPTLNYRLADLLMENESFGLAAVEYEKTAYDYPVGENSSKAGYAAVYAYRQALAAAPDEAKDAVKREAVRSSLKFADTYPGHEKAAIVLRAAANDLYIMEAYDQALAAATKLLEVFPAADTETIRAAWLISAHSSYELEQYAPAENAYINVLGLLPTDDETREGLVDNLAASIYKQGEQANAAQDYRAAADHFLRVGQMAPTSKIRPNAEYDGAMALMQIEEWGSAAQVLSVFRSTFPEHDLQPDVTQKLAYVYREDGKLSMAAGEYERIERESQDDEVRGEALQIAAELYEQDGESDRALEVYQRYVACFPQPTELNLETHNKIAGFLKARNDVDAYMEALRLIVALDSDAGAGATQRMHYLAAEATLVLAQSAYDQFAAVKLVEPIEATLAKKQALMKAATQKFGDLIAYEFNETTAAATFYLAEIYAHFSSALMASERPEGLSPLESEQYELAIEEQAYPFEEQAISVHESNHELISRGVYNEWIKKSMARLAEFMPARYDKPEAAGTAMASLETYEYAIAGSAREVSPDSSALAAGPGQVETPEGGGMPEATAGMDADAPSPADSPESAAIVVEGGGPAVSDAAETPAAMETVDSEEALAMESSGSAEPFSEDPEAAEPVPAGETAAVAVADGDTQSTARGVVDDSSPIGTEASDSHAPVPVEQATESPAAPEAGQAMAPEQTEAAMSIDRPAGADTESEARCDETDGDPEACMPESESETVLVDGVSRDDGPPVGPQESATF